MGARFTAAHPSSGKAGEGFSTTNEQSKPDTGSSGGGSGEGGGGHEPCCVTATVVTVTPAVSACCVCVRRTTPFAGEKTREKAGGGPVCHGSLAALFPIRFDFPCECRVLRRSLTLTAAAGILNRSIRRTEHTAAPVYRRRFEEMNGSSLNPVTCQFYH